MYKFEIITTGKLKENWLKLAIEEYEKRLTNRAKIEWIIKKDEKELFNFLKDKKNYICLDPKGKSFTSENFSNLLQKNVKTTFVIGGKNKIPDFIKKRAFLVLSLSSLTFTHKMTRVILIEQIYRHLEILKGSKYHE